MVILASEDIGNADPRALLVAVAAAQARRARRPAGGAAEPRAGGDLPRPRAEVERELRRAEGGDAGRPRARRRTAAGFAPRRELPGREEARPRRRLRLPPRRPGRLRGRLPAGRAEGPHVLPAVRKRRGGRGVTACTSTSGATRPAAGRLPPRGDLLRRPLRPARRAARRPLPRRRARPPRPRPLGLGAAVGRRLPPRGRPRERSRRARRVGRPQLRRTPRSRARRPRPRPRRARWCSSTRRSRCCPTSRSTWPELERADVSYAAVEDAVQARYDSGRVLLAPRELVIESDAATSIPAPTAGCATATARAR